ncbi:MAG: HEPN domain-containing protein [Candidatus Aenigmatarchaeota archaeon]
MGDKKGSNKIPALIWFKIAREDLKRAERAFSSNDFPDCVYRSQQATEKSIKTILELNEIIVRDHYVAEKLKDLIKRNIEFKNLIEIVEIARWFEKDKKWEITRYPIEKENELVLPEEVFTKEIASEALKKAKLVFDSVSKILKEKGVEI